jgi:hypothetical protein
MTRKRLLAETFAAAALAGAVIVLEAALHESLHVAWNLLFSGSVRSCGPLGPFTVDGGRLAACTALGGRPAWNALLTPLTVGVIGLVLMWASARLDRRWLRWGVFAGGVWTWAWETGYALGWIVPPTLVGGTVKYSGDGVRALEAFGWPAQIPGVVLFVLGLLVISGRVEYER